MTKFDEREKSFEKKFASDQELQFKINARRNKYLGEWAAEKLNKNQDELQDYIQEVIKSDFAEPGDEDVFRKIYSDFDVARLDIAESEIRKKMELFLELAKKDFT